MKFFQAIPFLLLNAACVFATTMELSREGLPAPHHRRSQAMVEELATYAVQTFYIPFPENIMFNEFFIPINRNATKGSVMSIIALAISTDNTIIWYDHWEDGYDADSTNITSASKKTEIWGDGNATNGCQPTIVCTDAADALMAGMSFVIQNIVDPVRNPLVYRYDGGDKVATNFPIAITRGGYPTRPGSVLAGAMEVLDTSYWGTEFIAPVGNNTVKASFDFAAFLVMAKDANTTVELRGPTTSKVVATYFLNEGESRLITTRISQPLTSNKPIQVAMITGDIDSIYESRWYSLLDLKQWSTQYVTPTGETFGKTKMVLYNPNNVSITVSMETRNRVTGAKILQNVGVPSKNYALSPYVSDGTGAYVSSSKPFLPLSITDAERFSADNKTTEGQMYDWGFPVQPLADLTSQVLIAWGYGCTDKMCGPGNAQPARSVVWITAVEDADLYIDYKNSGNTTKIAVKRLQSVKITDPVDKDMSGAMIFATVPNGTPSSKPVNIAASWGQDPVVSFTWQNISLDLGTTVLPFFNVIVNKVVDKEYVSPDEYLIYTIRVYNLGQSRIDAKIIRLRDTLDPWVDYVPGTTTVAIVNTTYIQAIPDDVTGTAFPLDSVGALIPYKLDPRGGMVDVTFEVKLKPASVIQMSTETIVNTGTMQGTFLPTLPFEAISKVLYKPNITLTNTVYLGNDVAGSSCSSAVEYVEGYLNTDVVYCFKITNNGHTFLNNVTLQDGELTYTTNVGVLAPGASIVVPLVSSILTNLTNIATVNGHPVFQNGTDVPDVSDVNATDPSAVGILPFLPNITLTNTVYLGNDNAGDSCSAAVEYVEGYKSTGVVYCFNITNTGNTYLGNITLANGALSYTKNGIVNLAPGESVLLPYVSSILSNLTNDAIVVGNPVFLDGTDIAGLPDVTATDPSSVGILQYLPNITLTNTVYLGSDSAGASCSAAVEYVEGYKKTDVVYCFNITNNGNTYLGNISLTNGPLVYTNTGFVTLAPGESVLVPFVSNITANLTNIAVVVGNPVLANGTAIPDLEDVTATDPSAVGLLEHKPNITLTNTVYIGSDSAGASCSAALEYVEGYSGTDVVYCFNITNNGSTHLSNITLTNGALVYTETGIATLAPGESILVPFVSNILSNLTNTAVVVGNPVLPNGTDIVDLDDVTATDPSSVGLLQHTADISITNTVYLGGDSAGASCAAAVEFVEGYKGTSVVYCFNVTNTGNTYLSAITISDNALTFNTSGFMTLSPGQSVLVPYVASILSNLTNVAVVTGDPVYSNGTEIPNMVDVTDSDPSEVGILVNVYPPENNQTCLQDRWNETGTTPGEDLICTTKDVYVDSMVSKPITCVLGSLVNVSVSAFISIASTRSDLGWYIAADGGDALEGNCIVEGLEEQYKYYITNTTFGGEVTWLDDECGDVTINGTGAILEVPTFVHATIMCADENKDNKIDLSVCFTWDTQDTDGLCSITSSKQNGGSPHLTPGSSSMCYCESYNIPNSTVVDPNDDVVPCS